MYIPVNAFSPVELAESGVEVSPPDHDYSEVPTSLREWAMAEECWDCVSTPTMATVGERLFFGGTPKRQPGDEALPQNLLYSFAAGATEQVIKEANE